MHRCTNSPYLILLLPLSLSLAVIDPLYEFWQTRLCLFMKVKKGFTPRPHSAHPICSIWRVKENQPCPGFISPFLSILFSTFSCVNVVFHAKSLPTHCFLSLLSSVSVIKNCDRCARGDAFPIAQLFPSVKVVRTNNLAIWRLSSLVNALKRAHRKEYTRNCFLVIWRIVQG